MPTEIPPAVFVYSARHDEINQFLGSLFLHFIFITKSIAIVHVETEMYTGDINHLPVRIKADLVL